MFQFRYSLVIDFESNPTDYEGSNGDPLAMAAMDLESIKSGALSPYDLGDAVVEKIEQVKE